MPYIDISIKAKNAEQTNDVEYVCGNSDYVIRFDFDEEWDSHEVRTARFRFNRQFVEMVFIGNECPVPIIENTYSFEVGVYAGELCTTTPAYVPCKKSILCGDAVPAPVRPEAYCAADALKGKQDKLIAGDGITIDDNVISADGHGDVEVDSKLSDTSTNPLQNKVVTAELEKLVKIDREHSHAYIQLVGSDNIGVCLYVNFNDGKPYVEFAGSEGDERVELRNISAPVGELSAANKAYVDTTVAEAIGEIDALLGSGAFEE